MKNIIDLTKIYKDYKGKWVALKDDEKTVIAFGLDAKKVYLKALKSYKRPILMKVPKEVIPYIGSFD